MKVLVVINLYPPHAYGGYEQSCRDVVQRWRARGHVVEVLTTATRLTDVTEADDDPAVHRELEWYWAEHHLVRPPPRDRLRIERANRRRLATHLDRLRPDVVSMWAMGGMSLSLLSFCISRKQPTALVVEDEWLTYGPRIDAWLSAWTRRPRWSAALVSTVARVSTRAPALPAGMPVAFVSDFLRQRARTAGSIGFVDSEIVPLGISFEDFPLRQPNAGREWRGRLVGVGRIEARKGFDIAVRALAELPDVTLRLVGPSDGHLDDLVRLAESLGVATRLSSDVVPRSQLAAVYAAADAVVFPSRWEEPFGLVPLEAMSQAAPVIATRRGGSAEFLSDEDNCLEIPVDDPSALADAVRRLAASQRLRDRLVEGGLVTAARYDVARFADQLEDLHLHAAGRASG